MSFIDQVRRMASDKEFKETVEDALEDLPTRYWEIPYLLQNLLKFFLNRRL